MLRYIVFISAALTLFAAPAQAKSLTYSIDHGTVGVISSGSAKARLVLQPAGQCAKVAYSVIADGVLAAQGTFDLSKARSMPLDYTMVTLSCGDGGITAEVNQVAKSDSLF